MKVLMVVNWYTPVNEEVYTAGVFHYEQAIELKKHIDIRLYWPMEPQVNELYGKEEKGLFTYRSPWNPKKSKVSWFISTYKYMKEVCKDYKPDIIHANVAYPAGLISVIIGKKLKIPVVLTEHAPIEQMHLDNFIYKTIRKYVYKKVNANVCVSEDSKNRLSEIFPKINYQVIYNAVINPDEMPIDEITYKREGYINCAIVAGFYDQYVKGYQYLLPALKNVVEQGKKVTLHICGGGKYEEVYKELARELKIEDNCIFYGQCNRKKVYSIVRQMDFCVSSSVYECSGVSVQEEMLLGKPILVTKSGGANSLTNKNTAMEVDRQSVESLQEGILSMMEKYDIYNKEYIRKYAYENFEISNVTKRYLELFKKILFNK